MAGTLGAGTAKLQSRRKRFQFAAGSALRSCWSPGVARRALAIGAARSARARAMAMRSPPERQSCRGIAIIQDISRSK